MKLSTLVRRGLTHYWRTNVAVVLGVATAVAVLAGALLVGDSVRGSLRDLVLQRLGRVDRAVFSSGFFRDALATDLARDPEFAASFQAVAPIVVMQGLVTDQASGRRASHVAVYGVDDRFWQFHQVGVRGPQARDAFVSRALASDIGASSGSDLVVRVERPSAIPIESLHGRKDNLGRSLRLVVRTILAPADLGDFSLQPGQGEVRAVFVPLKRLQQDLEVPDKVNALLVAERADRRGGTAALETLIRRRFALEDVGVSVRALAAATAVESAAGLVDPPRVKAIDAAAVAASMRTQAILTYLANVIRHGDRQVPYSLVTAMDLSSVGGPERAALPVPAGAPAAPEESPSGTRGAALSGPPSSAPIVLNDWTARELSVKVGEPVTIEYFVWEDPGRLLTRTADFQVVAIVPIAGAAADRDLAPVYPGISEAKTFADWNPPFPIDLKRVHKIDEDYWDKYRTTPKGFIPLEVGQRLWASRFGDRTSVRVAGLPAESPADGEQRFATALRAQIDPFTMGLTVRDVRADGLAASRGATDFGEYFSYFSFFLVVSALMLAALFFRLSVEQRAREVGLLRAVGFSGARVRRLFSVEGFVLALIGSVLGTAGAVAYGAVMMAGLRTWWSGAVGTTALRLHVSPVSLAAGAAGALVAAMVCIWWTLRMLSRLSERSLLAGEVLVADVGGRPFQGRRTAGLTGPSYEYLNTALIAAIVFAVLGGVLLAASAADAIDRAGAFFGAGTSLLVACLCAVTAWLRVPPRSQTTLHRWPVWRIGVRNAADRPGRSVLAIGVIASATFILIAVGAFRRDGIAATDRQSGVGGYPLLVDLLLPIVNDPNSLDGREAIGLSRDDRIAIEPFRVLPGDDASCLNLYEPRNPRVLGASHRFIASGRFAFQGAVASTDAERANPWLLLERDLGADTVPVIADANSMTYVLHKQLGDDVVITRDNRPLRLRLVAALADSIFQGELLMSDANFARVFPAQEGYRFLLVDAPADRVMQVAAAIEEGAGDLGADAVETTARLAEFHRVENTYLSTFQTLGGLGLLVGTLGLAAVVLRNVLERRRELALLGAVGYRRRDIFIIIVAENLLLLAWGLAIGIACASVAIVPAIAQRGGHLPVTGSAALLLGAVFAAGLMSSLVATRAALRTPLLQSLRSE
jgi:ABC-type lipoprotein release transport system permease subunit